MRPLIRNRLRSITRSSHSTIRHSLSHFNPQAPSFHHLPGDRSALSFDHLPGNTMPKTSRASASQGQYRSIPVAIADSAAQQQQNYYPIPTNTTTMQSNLGPQRMTHMHPQAPSYIANPPMQASAPQYIPQSAPIPISTRPSSGAWSPGDDILLMNARTQGQNWGQIDHCQCHYILQHYPTRKILFVARLADCLCFASDY